jgi:hypothetical protein
MKCHAKSGSASDLAQVFFGFLKPTDSDLGESDEIRLAQYGFDERKFRDEIRYLRAFAVYYSTWEILGESPEGNALRTAFMGIWDKASTTSAANMQSYNEFFKRIELYGKLVNTGSSVSRGLATDRVPMKFAEFLYASLEPSSVAQFATCASTHFNSTCKVVEEALRETEITA